MNRFLLLTFLFIPLFTYSQVNEITFNHQRINFSAAPRTAISPMSIKMWDNYQNGGPSTYGTVLEFYGLGNHQTGQLYFGGWDNSKIRYREAFYAQNTWSDWMTLLDSKNDVESGGNLKISGSGNHYILNGNVGIGTNEPSAPFEIISKTIDRGLIVGGSGKSTKLYLHVSAGDYGYLFMGGNTTIRGNGNESYFDGSIGIGVNPGNYKLNVAGRIRADEIVVNTTGADFVFEPTYKLLTLSELETFIRTNKHLPDIAPAKEMQQNGVSAGEMQAKLLQKVEELTLYLIELKKENQELINEKNEHTQQLIQLNKRIKALENR